MKRMPWNCLPQMVLKDLIISSLQSVERLLLLSAFSEPALLPVSKANFRWCHPIQQKMLVDYMGWAQSSLWLPSRVSHTMSWNKNPHMFRHAPELALWKVWKILILLRQFLMYIWSSQEKLEREEIRKGREIKRWLWKLNLKKSITQFQRSLFLIYS